MHAKGLAAFLSFLMLFLLLLTGCGGTQRSDPEQTTGSEQEPSSLRSASSETLPFSLKNPSAPKRISNQQAQLLFDSSSAKGEAKKIRYLSNFCGDLFCMSYAGLDGEQDSNITSFAIYDGKRRRPHRSARSPIRPPPAGMRFSWTGDIFTLGMAVRMLAAPISTI